MNISIKGMLLECSEFISKSGKVYYNANVFFNGRVYRVGVPLDLYNVLSKQVNSVVEIKDITLFISDIKAVNFYVKG